MLTPLYLAEIAPARERGALVSFNQLAVTLGILVSYLVGYAFAITAPGDGCWPGRGARCHPRYRNAAPAGNAALACRTWAR